MKKKEYSVTLNKESIEKSDSLILFIVFSFFLCFIYFTPRLSALLVGDDPLSAKISVVVFIITLNMMWLYGIYHFAHIVFSLFTSSKINKGLIDPDFQPKAAILYMACNDFNENACETCVEQDYPDYKVFICDDSSDEKVKMEINTFYQIHRDKVEILRRNTGRGFKAGNMNDALKLIDRFYEYIAVVDADSMHPKDFLKKLLPYFTLSPKIAYVQAEQKSLKTQKSGFAGVLKSMIDLHWKFYMPLKNLFGFVMWYGHGAVLKRSVIDEVGGIPEVATEDLAFSSEARRLGYYGVVAEDVKSEEEFPVTLEKFRKRNRKWVRGTYQYLLRFYPKLLSARNVPWFEKADVFISAFSLLMAFPFLLLVYVASFVMPFYYAKRELQGPLFLVPPLFYDNLLQVILKTRYNVFWVFDFYLIMLVTIFFPLLPAVILFWRSKKEMLKYIALSNFVNISVLLDSAKEILAYTFTAKVNFYVTNDAKGRKDSRLFLLAEFGIGAYLIFFAFLTYNLWLVTLGFAFLLTPFIIFLGYRKPLEALVPLPMAITSAIMLFIGITIIQNL